MTQLKMLSRQHLLLLKSTIRQIHKTSRALSEYEHPLSRTWRILKEDFQRFKSFNKHEEEKSRALMGLFPRHTDILVIGGGAVGSSIAYWLKEKTSREGIRVVVIEKDMTYAKCTTTLSAGALHQQYSLPENIKMSMYGAEFLRTLKKRFGEGAECQYHPQGHLVLVDENGAQRLIDNFVMEKELGVASKILSQEQIKKKFPWLKADNIELGCLGHESQGWFDPWALFSVMRYGAMDMGAQFIQAEIVDFISAKKDFIMEGVEDGTYEGINEAIIKMPDGEHRSIEFAYCIIAAGTETLPLAQLAKIGSGSGMLAIPLPIKKKTKYVYQFKCNQAPPGINMPMTVDCSGIYFRRFGLGGAFLGGFSPLEEQNISSEDLFHQYICPTLRERVPAFESIKLKDAWTGSYEHNSYDDSGVLGPHPYYSNMYLATGFSPYGIQHTPAIGRAIAELILDGDFQTIDLTRFGFDRFIVDKPMYENGVI